LAERKAARVALTGYYGAGNFGDDLMAVIFGQHLQAAGIRFRVYRLCKAYAEPAGFEVAGTPEELLEGVDLLVHGGGGMLVNWRQIESALLFPGAHGAGVTQMALERGVRQCLLSVGGDGTYPKEFSPPDKEALVQAAEYVSVRNPADRDALQERGIQCDYFPDIVWQAARLAGGGRPRSRGVRRVGIDIYFSNMARQGALHILPLLAWLMRSRRDVEFVLMDSTNRTMRPYRGLGMALKGRNAVAHQFSDLAGDLALLGSLDLLITSRLHTMLAALACGVPAISVYGEKKTRLMLETLDRRDLYYGSGRAAGWLKLMMRPGELERLVEGYELPDTASLASGSEGHLRALLRLVELS